MYKTNQIKRPEQLKLLYLNLIDNHLQDLIHNRATEMYEIKDFAGLMCIHPNHLSNTIKDLTGHSPCGLYQFKILEAAQNLLFDSSRSIREVAIILTFEPSQFSKWFKGQYGFTPSQYRLQLKEGGQSKILKS